MYQFPIGVMLESFRMETVPAIRKAAEIGAKGIQMYATKGAHAPENMSASDRRELLDIMKSNGLCFSALCGDLGKGFTHPELNPELIEKSKRIVEMALDLETNIVTTHIGVVPEDPSHPRYAIMQDACGQLAEFADSMGAHFAVETGPETSVVLKSFLDGLHSTGVAVNLDPANLVMVAGDDPVAAVHHLQKYIVHTHAKDGVMLTPSNIERLYGTTPHPGDPRLEGPKFKELPLGQGDVPFPAYLTALEEIGFRGFLTIEREVGGDPVGDITMAADFLRTCMANG